MLLNMESLEKPTWIKISEKELVDIIKDLSQKYAPSQVGMILRDQYGVPTTRVFGKKLKKYLEDLGIETKEDLVNAEKKVDSLKEHMKNNTGDKRSKHKLQKAQAHLNRTKRYYGISIRDRSKK
jgi:ribosomal protein S15P/S13E